MGSDVGKYSSKASCFQKELWKSIRYSSRMKPIRTGHDIQATIEQIESACQAL